MKDDDREQLPERYDAAAEARALLDAIGDELTDACGFLQAKYLPKHSPEAARFVLYNALLDTTGRYGAAVMQDRAGLAPTVRALADAFVVYLAATGPLQ